MLDVNVLTAERQWLDDVWQKLLNKLPRSVEAAQQSPFVPYTTENGRWKTNDIHWWANGFWPACMWRMFMATGESLYRDEAMRVEAMLDTALTDFQALDHDVGFLWLIQSGVRYALEGAPESYARTLFAADTLASRYNPNGFIRAWNGRERAGWAIIDCMMNLPLLYWASDMTGDPRYRLIAMRHADTAMSAFCRPDGSCDHIVVFDPETGAPLERPAGQGYASGSCWSRGQAWALYGFTISYLCTGKAAYLDTAKRSAEFFLSNLADDSLARCDFRQPAEPDLMDDAATAIAASGLLELSMQVCDRDAQRYQSAAVQTLKALARLHANWSDDDPALLTHCTSAWSDLNGRHITMTYADYFFVEALCKLRGDQRLSWMPQRW